MQYEEKQVFRKYHSLLFFAISQNFTLCHAAVILAGALASGKDPLEEHDEQSKGNIQSNVSKEVDSGMSNNYGSSVLADRQH
jgi:hypothetical protein